MIKKIALLIGFALLAGSLKAQITVGKFGSGIKLMAEDSSYYMKIGLRFQNLITADWSLEDESEGYAGDFEANAMVRRSRLKFDGWALNKRLRYKVELSLSNRDNGGGNIDEFGNAANIILDAAISYKFYKNFSVKFGQAKLAGNRERVISSGDLQFVDRSRLNSRFTLDRDVFLQLSNSQTFGEDFILRAMASMGLGEGKNQIDGYHDGFDYTYRIEVLPFGIFQSKGDYVGSSIEREQKPKLSLGITFDNNRNAIRERGQRGNFIVDSNGEYFGKDLNSWFVDLMFKYEGFSLMGEWVDRSTGDKDPLVFDPEAILIGQFYTGSALNLALGFLFENNIELALRYTGMNADASTDEAHYTLGLNKFFVGHKLKLQTDFSLINREEAQNSALWRTQVEIHF